MRARLLFSACIFCISGVSGSPSGRTVYNLHNRPAHWASARATCAGYDAHLVSVESAQDLQADLETLDLLDWDGAFQSLMSTGRIWTGLHRSRSPDGQDALTWDTCTTFTSASSPNGNIEADLVSGSDFCTSMAGGFVLEARSCDQQLPFICQLELEPSFLGKGENTHGIIAIFLASPSPNRDRKKSLMTTGRIWTGLHRSRSPDGQDALTWDTCTTFTSASSPNGNIEADLVSGSDFCTSMAGGFVLEARSCDQQLPFICQLELGQCWFLPLDGRAFSRSPDIVMSGDARDCAQACRNEASGDKECWGFVASNGNCELYMDSAGHVFVRDPTSHLVSDSSSTAHVKICTGGNPMPNLQIDALRVRYFLIEGFVDLLVVFCLRVVVRSGACGEFGHSRTRVPQLFQPGSGSAYHPSFPRFTIHIFPLDPAGHTLLDWNSGICYCDCETPPAVLSPDYLLSSPEEKAEQINSELLVNPTDTSKAHRRLSCADDPRPSAKSVGSVGIVLLTIVFGGLIVLDLDVLWRHLKDISNIKQQQQHQQQQQQQQQQST
ncbi:hypothetical protein EGW08_006092 [Elysia chlorotica]|uniref:C-type lectin domain-containing protein n=1 Tax=Elysia chlorotica TaxID=188477 RepID=A0A433TX18_ELYCH|nr:hypothetical protein EGW08_006092 [Elysia chlorotica]